MTDEALAEALVPIAAELIGTVREYGVEDVSAVLARVPAGRHDALAVVLAAMVDCDRSPSELLGWINAPPVLHRSDRKPREHGTTRGYNQHFRDGDPTCRDCREAHRVARAHRREARV